MQTAIAATQKPRRSLAGETGLGGDSKACIPALERTLPAPLITSNRAVAVSKLHGAEAAAGADRAAGGKAVRLDCLLGRGRAAFILAANWGSESGSPHRLRPRYRPGLHPRRSLAYIRQYLDRLMVTSPSAGHKKTAR